MANVKPTVLTPKEFCGLLYVIVSSVEGRLRITDEIHHRRVGVERVEILERYLRIYRWRNSSSLRGAKMLWKIANWLWLTIPDDVAPPEEWAKYFNEETKHKGKWD